MNNKRWENSEYEKMIRITAEDLDYIKLNRQQLSAAGFLKHIIRTYREQNQTVDK